MSPRTTLMRLMAQDGVTSDELIDYAVNRDHVRRTGTLPDKYIRVLIVPENWARVVAAISRDAIRHTDRVHLRVESSLKRSFESAARFRHMSLSQFLVQAGIAAVEEARAKGLGIKQPSAPRDGRRSKPIAAK